VKLRCDPDPGKDGESQSGGARMTLQVIRWTTGNVGRRALRAILRHPDFELVGVFARSPTKVGVDAADLCGHDTPTGIRATDDVDAGGQRDPAVVAAPPGIATHLTLPLVTAQGFVTG